MKYRIPKGTIVQRFNKFDNSWIAARTELECIFDDDDKITSFGKTYGFLLPKECTWSLIDVLEKNVEIIP